MDSVKELIQLKIGQQENTKTNTTQFLLKLICDHIWGNQPVGDSFSVLTFTSMEEPPSKFEASASLSL